MTFVLLTYVTVWLAEPLYVLPPDVETRWSSFENLDAAKGAGGTANRGAKGHAFESVAPGETKTLLDVKGSGTVRRMWLTLSDRSPAMLRSLRFRCYWDEATAAAVDVPLGDFYGAVFGRLTAFENECFGSPEGRSLTTVVPMPFRTAARITITNESDKPLAQLFFDVNCTLGEAHGPEVMYFHAVWRRENPTKLGQDFELLPKVMGRGRYLGTHVGVRTNPKLAGWWGEGEVKVYLDGDTSTPTLVGTGTEDYIGTAYGQGVFHHRFQGCWIADYKEGRHAFYRYHIPDPVYFHKDIRVTLQQMGGAPKGQFLQFLATGARMKAVQAAGENLLEKEHELDLTRYPSDAWVNYYREDDVCATTLFYLDKPEHDLPPLAPLGDRLADL